MQKHLPSLLPVPRHVEFTSGAIGLNDQTRWTCDSQDPRVTAAMRRLADSVSRFPGESSTRITVVEDIALDVPGDGYRMVASDQGITITGRTPAACLHGLQTLDQLIDPQSGQVPGCVVTDGPDFATRGLLFDITRGRVPTLATFKNLVDRLAALKVNQLQLNIEHSFVFTFDPKICGPDEGLTHDEVRELDDYCQARFITLVPALANLGHMGRILTMPQYRHLAEIETTADWKDLSWPQRLRGLTLDAANPQAWSLVQRMWTDILAAFSAPLVNMCGDEPWDLGEGKNKQRCVAEGKADLYLAHLRRVQDFCALQGRSTQFWGDVVRNYPQQLTALRPDGQILHWGYDDRSDYEGTATFVASGLPTMVCPGTSGWKRTLNALNLAERNIRTFAEVGRRAGAKGLINTDWGDHGHFNLPASSWHGMALGAAFGWRADHPSGPAFDQLWTRHSWAMADPSIAASLRTAARLSDECETWRMLWMDAHTVASDATLPTLDRASEGQQAAEALQSLAYRQMASLSEVSRNACARNDWTELALAADFTALTAEKMMLILRSSSAQSHRGSLMKECASWAEKLQAAGGRYAQLWHRQNKPLRLADIEGAIARAATDLTDFVAA